MDFSAFLKNEKCGSCFLAGCLGGCDAGSQAPMDEEMMVPVLGLVKGPGGQCKLAPEWVPYCERSAWQRGQEQVWQARQAREQQMQVQLGQLAQGWATAIRVQRVCEQAEGFCGCLDCPECMLIQEALVDLLSKQVTKEAALWARVQVMACKKIADLEEPVNEWIWDEAELGKLGIRI